MRPDHGERIRLGLLRRRIMTGYVQPDQPGAAVLVVAGGRVVHRKAYGLADMANGVPVTLRTAFNLASVSKQFTAMGIMILTDSGRLRLEEDVRVYVPELPVYDARRPIRLVDLLWHTSGIPDYSSVWKGASKETRLTKEGYLPRLVKHALDFPSGTRAEYSNSNYILLAVVIERVSGRPFRRFMREAIFDPLGMKDSLIHDEPGLAIPRRAHGYRRTQTGTVRRSDIPIVLAGHSHLFSTIPDLARWEQAFHHNTLVRPETLARAFTRGTLDNGQKHIYGFGWYEESVNGYKVFAHSGGWYGFSSYVCRFLEEGLMVAVLSNSESLDVEGLGRELAGLYLRNSSSSTG